MVNRSTFTSPWQFRDKVHIDEDKSITGIIKAFSFTEGSYTICVSWFSNGDAKEFWFDEWRLSHVD